MKYFDFDDEKMFWWVIGLRVFQALFMTRNKIHPDEYWQVNQISYLLVYPDVKMELTWEFFKTERMRCFIYPVIQAIPMWIFKFFYLDTWWIV